MKTLDAELRRTSKQLKAVLQHARRLVAAHVMLDQAHCDELRALVAEYDQLVILKGGVPGAPKITAEAIALIERCDPLASLRSMKLDYIDRLAATCDALMTAGQMPEPHYVNALGSAVGDYESEHSSGNDAYLLSFAWDILAQAEAGLGEPTNDAHYELAEHRYRRARRGAAPVLALVSSH